MVLPNSLQDTETRYLAFSIFSLVYNEEEGIGATLTHLQETLKSSSCPYPYEIVVVNDGSKDDTRQILLSFEGIHVIEHRRNQGYGAALKTGIRHAKYPLIVITDGDGTYPNQDIPHLVSLTKETDMVVGARIGANVTYPTIRKIPKWCLVRFD